MCNTVSNCSCFNRDNCLHNNFGPGHYSFFLFRKFSFWCAPRMHLSVSAAILCILVVGLLPEATYARPYHWLFGRQRRQSDQRLAEIETYLALQRLKGVAVPVGFGKINPAIVGRKRRSIPEDGLVDQQGLISPDADFTPDQTPLLWKEDPREKQRNYQLI